MSLIPVMIVDDDYLVIQDLKSMVDWHALGFNIVATATNGKQALDLYRKTKPKLIITDIIMPIMSGLEFIENIKSEVDDQYIFILTSYDEFEYAKRALKDGVKDYILKNELDTYNLTSKLTDVSRYYFEDKQILWSSSYLSLCDYFSNPLSKKKDIDSPLFESLNQGKYYFYVITEQLSLPHPSLVINEAQESGLQLLRDLKEIYLNERSIPILFNLDHLVIVGIQDNTMSFKHAKVFAKMTLDTLKDHTGKDHLLFYGENRYELKAFKALFLTLKNIFDFYTYFSKKTMVSFDPLRYQSILQSNQVFDYTLIRENRQNRDKLLTLLRSHIAMLFEYHDFSGLMTFYSDIFGYFDNISNFSNSVHIPRSHISADDFIEWFESTMDSCLSKASEQQMLYSPSVKNAISYISMHYGDFDLTAEIIGEHVGLSAGRLNILFKQETNQTLNVFLTNLRVEKAIQLLVNSNLKIYEISEKVGYRTSQYFSQMIYSKTGKRPIDFRKPTGKV